MEINILFWIPLLALAGTPTSQAATPSSDLWMTVRMNGHVVGRAHETTAMQDGIWATNEHLTLAFTRDGEELTLNQSTHSEERSDHVVLALSIRTSINGIESSASIQRRSDGRYEWHGEQGRADQHPFRWPEGVLLSEGQRLALREAGHRPGKQYTFRLYDPTSQSISTLRGTVIGREVIDLPIGTMSLTHHRQLEEASSVSETRDIWVDLEGRVMRERSRFLGQTLEMEACSAPCEQIEKKKIDLFRVASVPSPGIIERNDRHGVITYQIKLDSADAPIPETPEQEVVRTGPRKWQIVIHGDGSSHSNPENPPSAPYLQPNPWVQADDPAIRRLSNKTVGMVAANAMQHLERAAERAIISSDTATAYATASDALRSHRGDCTEYAVLLAALARARHIPSRVVFGLVYVDGRDGRKGMFLPHAWTQAWVDGSWKSYDAALGQFDAAHIALTVGAGTPASMSAAATLMGGLRIVSAEVVR